MVFKTLVLAYYSCMENYINYIVNAKSLKYNAKLIRQRIGSNCKLCAMVKANAYGHGIEVVCRVLKSSVDFFGTATVQEAEQIRNIVDTPVLLVAKIYPKNVNWCAKNNISVTVDSLQELQEFEKLLKKNQVLKVHLKINTGLNRIGFNNIEDFLEAYSYVTTESTKLQLEGVYTHYATKGNDVAFIMQQYSRFLKYINKIDTTNIIVHCCNSYATDHYDFMHHDMVRCGFNLYGYSTKPGYKPVAKIASKIISMHNVPKGQTIGYDRSYKAQEDMIVGVVAMGYADGLDRRNSNKSQVIINGQLADVVGNICMDVCMVDLTHVKGVKLWDEVVILGNDGKKEISPQYYADILDTSAYEVLLKFNQRRSNIVVKKF